MLASALIVFREVLEAALIIGIVAAAAHNLPHRARWISAGLLGGIAGAILIALSASEIAELADGIGQELMNALILACAVLMLGWHNIWMARHARELAGQTRAVIKEIDHGQRDLSAIAIVIALAVLREGSETALFLWGISTQGASSGNLLIGGLFGLGAGVALGWLLYRGLLRIPLRWLFSVTAGMILLLAAGMASQMASYLQQAGLLSTLGRPVWNSSHWLPDHSGFGAFLHILIGYDARPNLMQILFYGSVLLFVSLGMYFARPSLRPANHSSPPPQPG